MITSLKKRWFRSRLPSWIQEAQSSNTWIILCYHRFEATCGKDPIPGMSVSLDAFRTQLDLLQELGDIVSLDEGLKGGKGLRFSVTFDDGYQDNLTVLLPELESRGIPATVYVTSSFVSGEMPLMTHDRETGYSAPAMTPEECRELASHPLVTIGAHGATHLRFNGLTPQQWEEELTGAKTELERICSQTISHFAYTYGPLEAFDWVEGPAKVAEAGYDTLASNAGGRNDHLPAKNSPVHLKRIPSIASTDRDLFLGWIFSQQHNLDT